MLELLLIVSAPRSTSNGYLARFWQILPESCKIMHNLARFLPESCKITVHSARILQDNHFSARILQDSNYSAESYKIIVSLSESSIISTFLHKILQDELINASNSDSKRFARKLFQSPAKLNKWQAVNNHIFWALARKLKRKELNKMKGSCLRCKE